MSDLIAWLTEVLDGDEAYAGEIDAPDGFYPDPYDPGSPLRHEALLADIAAKRATIAFCVSTGHPTGEPWGGFDQVVRLLASAYADRPGYDEAWKP